MFLCAVLGGLKRILILCLFDFQLNFLILQRHRSQIMYLCFFSWNKKIINAETLVFNCCWNFSCVIINCETINIQADALTTFIQLTTRCNCNSLKCTASRNLYGWDLWIFIRIEIHVIHKQKNAQYIKSKNTNRADKPITDHKKSIDSHCIVIIIFHSLIIKVSTI